MGLFQFLQKKRGQPSTEEPPAHDEEKAENSERSEDDNSSTYISDGDEDSDGESFFEENEEEEVTSENNKGENSKIAADGAYADGTGARALYGNHEGITSSNQEPDTIGEIMRHGEPIEKLMEYVTLPESMEKFEKSLQDVEYSEEILDRFDPEGHCIQVRLSKSHEPAKQIFEMSTIYKNKEKKVPVQLKWPRYKDPRFAQRHVEIVYHGRIRGENMYRKPETLLHILCLMCAEKWDKLMKHETHGTDEENQRERSHQHNKGVKMSFEMLDRILDRLRQDEIEIDPSLMIFAAVTVGNRFSFIERIWNHNLNLYQEEYGALILQEALEAYATDKALYNEDNHEEFKSFAELISTLCTFVKKTSSSQRPWLTVAEKSCEQGWSRMLRLSLEKEFPGKGKKGVEKRAEFEKSLKKKSQEMNQKMKKEPEQSEGEIEHKERNKENGKEKPEDSEDKNEKKGKEKKKEDKKQKDPEDGEGEGEKKKQKSEKKEPADSEGEIEGEKAKDKKKKSEKKEPADSEDENEGKKTKDKKKEKKGEKKESVDSEDENEGKKAKDKKKKEKSKVKEPEDSEDEDEGKKAKDKKKKAKKEPEDSEGEEEEEKKGKGKEEKEEKEKPKGKDLKRDGKKGKKGNKKKD